jgi:hypothetical protein
MVPPYALSEHEERGAALNRHIVAVATIAFVAGALLSVGAMRWKGASASQSTSAAGTACQGKCAGPSAVLADSSGSRAITFGPSPVAVGGTGAADTASSPIIGQRKRSAVATSALGATAGTSVMATVSCDPGGIDTGGGGRVITSDGKNPQSVGMTQTYGDSDTSRVVVGVVNVDLAANQSLDVIATMVCQY